MEPLPETLRENVRLLGELLGETVRDQEGEALFQKLEDIRQLAKAVHASEDEDPAPLVERLGQLDDKDVLPIVRAFNQFLNLANIAEQEHSASAEAETEDSLQKLLLELAEDYGPERLGEVVLEMGVEELEAWLLNPAAT